PGSAAPPAPTSSAPMPTVEGEAYRIRTRNAAVELVARERAGALVLPKLIRLDQFLAQPDPEISYRIDQLWPSRGRFLLAAAWKAGKTTMLAEVLRSLADGVPFLDRFHTIQAGRIVLIDNELDEATLRRWLRDHSIGDTDRIEILSLRGRIGSFAITDPAPAG